MFFFLYLLLFKEFLGSLFIKYTHVFSYPLNSSVVLEISTPLTQE